jgi:histidyl-tRNA synthetase
METVLLDAPEFGSVFSGGRYNNLVSRFTGKDLPATGASIGVDRLFAALDHLKAINRTEQTVAKVIVLRIDKDQDIDYLNIATRLRKTGINTELCLLDDTTFKSQFNFAISRGVRFVIIRGENERNRQTVQVKNLMTRKQEEIPEQKLTEYFQTIED